jgi:hypothetical protein
MTSFRPWKEVGRQLESGCEFCAGGWRLSGAQVYYSGFPVTVSSPANYSSLSSTHLAARHGPTSFARSNGQPIHQRVLGNRGAGNFVRPNHDDGKCVFQGAAKRCIWHGEARLACAVRASRISTWRCSKSFRVWHEHRMEFRADFFNAFNIADYAAARQRHDRWQLWADHRDGQQQPLHQLSLEVRVLTLPRQQVPQGSSSLQAPPPAFMAAALFFCITPLAFSEEGLPHRDTRPRAGATARSNASLRPCR